MADNIFRKNSKNSADNKIVKYRKKFQINIGTVIFVIIFFYLIFNVFSYFTAKHLSVYEVEQGTIVENNTYNGLILRSENVFYSDYSGDINYYLKDASKASAGSLVYSVDESGTISSLIAENSAAATELDAASLDELSETVTDFKNSFDTNSFYSVYSFKEEIDSQIMEALNLSALETIRGDSAYTGESGGFHLGRATVPGIVVYYIDGFETVTPDGFSPDMLNELNYSKVNLKSNTSISSGDPVYKSITDETWYIIIQVSNDTFRSLANDDTLLLRFREDNQTSYATYEFENIAGNYYMILTLNNSMVRYATERYTEVELLLDEQTGLKIPNSSITEKEFFKVPKEYFSQGGDSSDYGVMKQTEQDGKRTYEFVQTALYYETDDCYYIAEDDIASGDILLKPDSTETCVVNDTASLKGVYNINKGYAVFKQINILYQNAEYTIVQTGTSYGISLYDHIALDGSKVSENELVN